MFVRTNLSLLVSYPTYLHACIVADNRRHGAAGQHVKMERSAAVRAECSWLHEEFLQQEDRREAPRRLDVQQ